LVKHSLSGLSGLGQYRGCSTVVAVRRGFSTIPEQMLVAFARAFIGALQHRVDATPVSGIALDSAMRLPGSGGGLGELVTMMQAAGPWRSPEQREESAADLATRGDGA
jgi:hypothetical protein